MLFGKPLKEKFSLYRAGESIRAKISEELSEANETLDVVENLFLFFKN